MKRLNVSFSLLLLCLVVAPAAAEEGRIPIFEHTTITQAGSYVLTRDIDATGAGSAAILVTVGTEDDVTIDLNGFAIIGQNGLQGIQAANLGKLEVRNGTIKAPPGQNAITVDGAGALVVEDVTFLRRSATAQPKAIYARHVRSVTIRDNVMNPFSASTMYGINVLGDPLNPTSGLIENNEVFTGSPAVVIYDTQGLVFRGNKLTGQTEIRGQLLTVDGNSVLGNRLSINFSTGCIITGNLATGASGGIAIAQSSDCLVEGNVLTDNDEVGLWMHNAHRCRVVGNVVTNNAQGGIILTASSRFNTFSQNHASGNGATTCGNLGQLLETCPAPYGGGNLSPDVCSDGSDNYSACDNFMPGPPRS